VSLGTFNEGLGELYLYGHLRQGLLRFNFIDLMEGLVLVYLLILYDEREGGALLPLGLNLDAAVVPKPELLRKLLALVQPDPGAGLIDVLGSIEGREQLEEVLLLLHLYA